MLRENPPLLQHMLEDELPFITKLLGERLVRETIYLNHHDALRDFVGDLAFKFRQRAMQLGQQKGGLLTVQHQRALARADDFAKGITGDVPLAPAIKSAPPIRRQRANPPLTQHMETEELSDLSALLAERLVREVVANKDGALLAAFLGDLGTQFRSSVRKVPRHKLSDQHAAILNAADDFAAEIEGFAGSSAVRRRANPPLSEHMAHDDLDEISALLVRRFVNPDDFHGPLSTRPTPEIFRKFVYNLAKNVAQAAESAAAAADGEVAYDALLSVYDVANDIQSAISTMRRTRRFR